MFRPSIRLSHSGRRSARSRNLLPLWYAEFHASKATLQCNPAPMAGVKLISLGCSTTFRHLPLVECVERIRRASQAAVFIHYGSRLDRGGRRTPVEPFQWKIVGTSG